MTPIRLSLAGFPFYPQKYISHLLIAISVVVTLASFVMPGLLNYGFNGLFLYLGNYGSFFVQLSLFQFLHAGVLHLLMNSYFLYVAGPALESRMSRDSFLGFFVGGTIFVAVALYFFTAVNVTTMGISGFCMALLSYLWLDLQSTRHPMTNEILMMLALNIGIGLIPGISLVGHTAGAVWGVIWWLITKRL